MTTKPYKNIAEISEKLQKDVDLILKDFFGGYYTSDMFEDHFNVDAILKSNFSVKNSNKKSHSTSQIKYEDYRNYTYHEIDAGMRPIDPHFHIGRDFSRGNSVFKKIGCTLKMLLESPSSFF